MPVNSRQKGKRIERFFATKLKIVFPEIRRNAGIQSQSGGVDLEETGCFNFEVKGGKRCNIKKIRGWLDQIESEGRKENFDVVLVKPDREKEYAIMPFDDFLEILQTLKKEEII